MDTSKWLSGYFSGLACVIAFLFAVPAYGDSSISNLSADQQQAINDRQDQLDVIQAKIKAYQKIVSLKKIQGATLSDQLDALNAEEAKLEIEIRQTQQQIADLSQGLKDVESNITEKERVMIQERQILSELIRSSSGNADDGSAILLASTGSDLDFLMKRDDWMSETNARITGILQDMAATKKSLEDQQRALVQKKLEIDALNAQLGQKNDQLQTAQTNKAALLVKTQNEQTKYSSLVDSLQQQRAQIADEIGALEAGLMDGSFPSASSGYLAYPVSDHIITQGYGVTSFAKTKINGRYPYGTDSNGKPLGHNGFDFGNKVGTPIYAAANGKVIDVGNCGNYAYGKWIAIDHGDITTLYGHLSSQNVKSGQSVKKGDKIGLMGNTGFSTASHLHFSVFSTGTFKVVDSSSVKGVSIPIGKSDNPLNWL
jgi:murein DD-endopeptidase MepM/ murein hydrolase activator NlpD